MSDELPLFKEYQKYLYNIKLNIENFQIKTLFLPYTGISGDFIYIIDNIILFGDWVNHSVVGLLSYTLYLKLKEIIQNNPNSPLEEIQTQLYNCIKNLEPLTEEVFKKRQELNPEKIPLTNLIGADFILLRFEKNTFSILKEKGLTNPITWLELNPHTLELYIKKRKPKELIQDYDPGDNYIIFTTDGFNDFINNLEQLLDKLRLPKPLPFELLPQLFSSCLVYKQEIADGDITKNNKPVKSNITDDISLLFIKKITN